MPSTWANFGHVSDVFQGLFFPFELVGNFNQNKILELVTPKFYLYLNSS